MKIIKTDLYLLAQQAAQAGKKILLHACCAPCASWCIKALDGAKTTVYFYNPNIMPAAEYDIRQAELKKLCGIFGVDFACGDYDNAEFLRRVSGLENLPEGGERCKLCYRQRLISAAVAAKNGGYDYFCTTLTLSPHKDSGAINTIGFEVAKEVGVEYLPSDFKKRGGYQKSIEICKQYGIYRQSYCGCLLK